MNTCPGCGGAIPNSENPGAYPGALSRFDNATEICSNCGMNEGLAQFLLIPLRAPGKIAGLHHLIVEG